MKTIKKLVYVLFAVAFLFAACSKEGPQGPKGDKGATGPRGATGAKGDRGPKGATGTANIIYSSWLSVDLKSGIYAGLYYAKISAPKITQSILDKGVMKVYVSSGNEVYEIPNSFFDGLYPVFSVGYLELFSPADWDTFSGYKFRYVLIPGGTTARKNMPVDYNDYHAVCKYYGIPE